MALLGEVAALLDLVGRAVSFARQAQDGWYKASEEVRAFPSIVSSLRQEVEKWRVLLRKFGLSNEQWFVPQLRRVEATLKEQELEVARLKKSCCVRLRVKLVFPGTLMQAVEDLTKAIADIPESIRKKQEAEELLEKFSYVKELPFSGDHRFVPLASTVEEVCSALKSKTPGWDKDVGNQVVVLYGGPGEGKTCLAKHVALIFQNDRKSKELSRVARDSSSDGTATFGDGTFFLSCGQKADIQSLLSDLSQSLGHKDTISPEIRNEQAEGNPSKAIAAMRDRLMQRLKTQDVLIVLDDIWDTAVLTDFVVQAPGVKYLITTRQEGVWPGALSIKIQKPTDEEAARIIANNVKLFKGTIPGHLKDEVEQIIKGCDSIPFELASMAFAIREKRALEVDEWRSKISLMEHLRGGDPKRRPPAVFDRSYSKKTSTDAILLSVDYLPYESRTLLYMASICEAPSVPEILFKLFFIKIHSQSMDEFYSCSRDLEEAGFMQVENTKVPWSTDTQRYWYIYGRRKDVIIKKRKQELDLLIAKAVPHTDHRQDDSEPDVLALLLVLYGHQVWSQEVAKKMGISTTNIELDSFTISSRNCLEYFVLILQDESSGLKNMAHTFSYQVIFQYLTRGELDDHAMSELLKLPPREGATAACGALSRMAEFLKTKSLLSPQHEGTVQGLLELLPVERNDSLTSKLAIGCLGWLSFSSSVEANNMVVAQKVFFPNLLQTLVANASDLGSELDFLWILGNVARSYGAIFSIGTFPGVFDAIEVLLGKVSDAHRLVQSSGVITRQHGVSGLSRQLPRRLKASDAHRPLQSMVLYALQGLLFNFGVTKHLLPRLMASYHILISLVNGALFAGEADEENALQILVHMAKHAELRIKIQKMTLIVYWLRRNVGVPNKNQYAITFILGVFDVVEIDKLLDLSSPFFDGRGNAKIWHGMYEAAISDFNRALELDSQNVDALMSRGFAKGMLKLYPEAMRDFDKALQVKQIPSSYIFQERGILKILMGDLDGALLDLDRGLQIDQDDYHILKHRGYVKYLKGDEEGARVDAERILARKEANACPPTFFGSLPVSYLEYEL